MDELEKVKKENEQLKLVIQSLRQQLESYKKQSSPYGNNWKAIKSNPGVVMMMSGTICHTMNGIETKVAAVLWELKRKTVKLDRPSMTQLEPSEKALKRL